MPLFSDRLPDVPEKIMTHQNRPLPQREGLSNSADLLAARVADLFKITAAKGFSRGQVVDLLQMAAHEAFHDVARGDFRGFQMVEGMSDDNYPTEPADLVELVQAQVAQIIVVGRERGMTEEQIITLVVGATLEGSDQDVSDVEQL